MRRVQNNHAVKLAVSVTFAASFHLAVAQSPNPRTAEIPGDLLETVKTDLGMGQPQLRRCFDRTATPLEKMVRSTRLALSPTMPPALLIEGLSPCFAGNDNGAKLVYAHIAGQWHKIFDAVGDTVELAKTRTNGWRDLILWQHDNAFRSARQFCSFDGAKYKSVKCNMVEFKNEAGPRHETLNPPRYRPCTQEFLAVKPE